jgi:hypothetical protein
MMMGAVDKGLMSIPIPGITPPAACNIAAIKLINAEATNLKVKLLRFLTIVMSGKMFSFISLFQNIEVITPFCHK